MRFDGPRPRPQHRRVASLPLLLAIFVLLFRFPNDRTRRARAARRPTVNPAQLKALRSAAFSLDPTDKRGHVVAICPLTHHLLPFFLNLRCHARRTMPAVSILPVALDAPTADILANFSDLPFLRLSDDDDDRSVRADAMHGFNTQAFRAVTKRKLHAVRLVLAAGFDALLLDADLLPCADVRTALRRELQPGLPAALQPHVLMQSNQRADAHADCELNTGFYLARSAAPTGRLFDAAILASAHGAYAHMDDQDLFQAVACGRAIDDDTGGRYGRKRGKLQHMPPNVPVSSGVCSPQNSFARARCVWRDDAVVQMLPVREFPSGRKNLWRRHADDTLRSACRAGLFTVYHANFRSGSSKRGFMEREGVWLAVNDSLDCREL